MDATLSVTTVMDVPVTVKNTFLDVAMPEDTTFRRSSSVPRSWMPGAFRTSSCCGSSVGGEDSTEASDKETTTPTSDLDSSFSSDKETPSGARTPISDSECFECDTDSMYNDSTTAEDTASTSATEATSSTPTIEVKLFDFIGNSPTRTKLKSTARPYTCLKSTARPFTSTPVERDPPSGMQAVIAAAKDVLCNDPGVCDVQMTQGSLSGSCTLVAHTRAPSRNPRYLIAMVKSALLSSAERSRDTYILGYEVKPFTKIDKSSFTTTLACISDAEQNTACWDTYKHGYCPRRLTCRWCHPSPTQMLRLIVRVQKTFDPQQSHSDE